jgi:hypothetical protein
MSKGKNMKVTRRDLLVWSAGATAGLVFSPVPWKLLDDVSIWSQNWPWIPQPARGPVEVKQSVCTLCPHGCGIRVKMAGGWPVGVAGVSTHPLSRGALCPLGFGAHQLNWHPKRLRTVRHGTSASSWDEAREAFAKASSEGPVVIIDGRPGRAASSIFETYVQKQGGSYRVALSPEVQALTPYEAWTGVPATSLGYDLENAQTVVSFGAPLLDSWGVPGRFTRLWAERAAGVADPQLRLIHIEASLSRTAARAWQWTQVHPGSEAALVGGLARVLLEEHLVAARAPMPPLTLVDAAAQTGLTTDAIRDLARTIVARPPALAIANDHNPAIAALNVILGAVGTRGGIVRKSARAKPYVPPDVIASARAVLIDSTVPWDFVPQTDAEVFRFAAWDGGMSKVGWLLPAPGFLEELTDISTAPTVAMETYAVASSLVKAPHAVHNAAEFLNSLDPGLPTVEKMIHTRCHELFRAGAGALHAQEVTPVAKLESAQKLEEQLQSGAVWVGEPPRTEGLRCELREWPEVIAAAQSTDWAGAWPAPVLPPLASKVCQESSLRKPPQGRTA